MLTIKPNKKYKTRDGQIVHSIHIVNGSVWCDDKQWRFSETGKQHRYNDSGIDLIEEVKEDTMKIEVGKYYKARNGHKVHIVEEIKSALDRTHLGIVHRLENPESNMSRTLQYYYADGMVMQTQTSDVDIIEEWKEPKSGVAYVNVYDGQLSPLYESRKYADSVSDNTRIACVRVEWKEGQFDD